MECIFCSIGGWPKNKIIRETTMCYVILDKYPSEYGHMLVVLKQHKSSMIAANENEINAMFNIAKEMSCIAKDRLGASGVNVATNIGHDAGQVIEHFHVHVIPRYGSNQKRKAHIELSDAESAELIAQLG